MAFGFQLRSAARRMRRGGPPGATVVGLPATAFIVARWSADTIPAQADDTPLTTWTDSVRGIAAVQATAAARPGYRTGGAGGKPFVLFDGDQLLDAGADNAVAAACRSGSSTVLVVCRNVRPTGFGFLFTATPSTGYNLFHNGSEAGFFGQGLQRAPYSGMGLTTLCYSAGAPDASLGRAYINGTCLRAEGKVNGAPGDRVAIGGSPALGFVGAKAEIYEVIVWDRALTAAEVMQAERSLRDKYGAAYSWAGGAFRVFHGDSLTNGTDSTGALRSYPARVAALNGWPIGSWTNLGHGGQSMAGLQVEALVDIDPMVPLLGSTPLHLAAWEWFNQRGASDPQDATIGYFRARRAAGVSRLVLATSTDATDGVENADMLAKRAAYDAFFDAEWRTYADAYVPLHADGRIGLEGACPATAPYGPYFSDGIHLTDAGYDAIAGLVAPEMA
ncbi:hypothetical protein [uncultured Sphingomonas sp.]|uniref:hypothetical protein n=1 Tax=uncultured Sphingomonas sp. TaxID=158754 RepID=UPI0035CA1174